MKIEQLQKLCKVYVQQPFERLEYAKKDVPKSTIDNFLMVLREDPRTNTKLRIPEGFKLCERNLRYLIFEGFDDIGSGYGRACLYYLMEKYGFKSRRGLNAALIIAIHGWSER